MAELLNDIALLQLALVAVGAMAVFLWLVPDGVCRCTRCSYHKEERANQARRRAETEHDAEHKGFGFRDTTPDRFNCHNPDCVRNKR